MDDSKKPKTRASGKPDDGLNPSKRALSDHEDEPAEVTRCICGHEELQLNNIHNKSVDPDFFIQCDNCYVWQHGFCVGILNDEEAPEGYFCERCRPDYHVIVVRPSGKTSKYSPQDYSADENDASETKQPSQALPPKKSKSPDTAKSAESATTDDPVTSTTADTAATSPGHDHYPHPTSSTSPGPPSTANGSHARRSHTPESKESVSTAEARRERRRLTLNSRDAAYEETLRRVLEESVNDGVPSPTTPSKTPASSFAEHTPSNHRSAKKAGLLQTDSQSGSDEPSHVRPRRRERTPSVKPSRPSKSTLPSSSTSNGSRAKGTSSSSTIQSSSRKRNLDIAGLASEDDAVGASLSPVEKSLRSRSSKQHMGRSAMASSPQASGGAGTDSNDNGSASATAALASPKRKRPRSRHGATGNTSGSNTRTKSGLSESTSAISRSSGGGSGANGTSASFFSSSKSSASSRHNGGMAYVDKPSKPRIPQARTSLLEMQKRVAAILEFIGRTRQDMDAEQADRKQLLACRMVRYKALYLNSEPSTSSTTSPSKSTSISSSSKSTTDQSQSTESQSSPPVLTSTQQSVPSTKSTIDSDTPLPNMSADIKAGLDIPAEHLKDPKFDCLFESYKPSFELMEVLTQKLVMWEQKFGSYGSAGGLAE